MAAALLMACGPSFGFAQDRPQGIAVTIDGDNEEHLFRLNPSTL
jgi:hypothetical protein